MSLIETLAYIRIVVYFLIATVFSILSFLYFYGYRNIKTSLIIKTLRNLFMSLGFYFLFLAIAVLFRYRQDPYFELLNMVCIIPAIATLYFGNKFIKYSIEEEEIQLPKAEGGGER